MTNKYGKMAIITASLILPLTLILSGLVAWQLKESNPDNVDVTAGLAYLRQILGTALVAAAILWGISLVSSLIGLKKDDDRTWAKLGMLVLVLVTITSITAGIVQNQVSDVEKVYKDNQAEQFFEKLRENN